MEEKGQLWQVRAAKIFVALAVVLVGYLLFSRVIVLMLPFLLAFFLSLVIRPSAAYLQARWHLPRRVGAIILLLLLLFLLGWLVSWGCRRLLLEAQRLLDHVAGGGELLGARIEQALEVVSGLSEHIPFLSRLKSREPMSDFWRAVDAKLAEIISDTLGQLSARIPAIVAGIVRGLPGVLVFAVTFLLAAFYLCADGERILSSLALWLPAGVSARLRSLRQGAARLGGRYLRAYFLLFLLTFGELVIGLSILRLPYVFLPALVISLVDVLPVLGVGTVLLPWGLIELLRGNVGTGTGLLILCGVMVLLRQLLEPRILGKSIGLHPLATLFAAYVGFELFGLIGMLFGPAVALVVKNVLESGAGREKKEKAA